MKQLKRYQEKALNKLITRTKELFEEKKEKATMVFQSPTGSGKTFMMSKYIEQMIKEFENEELCFLWVCMNRATIHLKRISWVSLTFIYLKMSFTVDVQV
jgi:type III restriction enzyme